MSATTQPPIQDATLVDTTGKFTTAWTQYFTSVSRQVSQIIAKMGKGVTDGSDAKPGDIGEYLSTTGTTGGLTSGTLITVATLDLTPGDWDITGSVTFHVSGATSRYGVGIDGVLGTEIVATVPSGTGTWQLSAGAPVRRNISANSTTTLVAVCTFTTGTVSCDGKIHARRMR